MIILLEFGFLIFCSIGTFQGKIINIKISALLFSFNSVLFGTCSGTKGKRNGIDNPLNQKEDITQSLDSI